MTSKENCTNQLADARVQQKLAEVLSFYFDDLQDILQLASAQNCGERPENLSNEVYSCFHHIARGMCARTTVGEALLECDKALDSHLKRATLDSYKLAVNSFLQIDKKLREILDYLVLVDDFEKYVPDGLIRINGINDLGAEVRKQLKLAKKSEAQGQFDSAMECFNEALEKAIELEREVKAFTTNGTYLLACAREARERNERKKDRWNVVIAAVLSAVITAAFMLGIPRLLPGVPVTDNAADQVGEGMQESGK
ncbi:MAG TPA: hypothetical protein VE890_17275 [Thermoguttaceae bacterium]|nr:hypothetical protein [Thermoguttaceae bacterium]